MTHYQKLATLIFRSVAVILMLLGVGLGMVGVAISFLSPLLGPMVGLMNSLPPIVLGIVLFLLSRILASFICHDFETFSRS